jgi:hypothetical protein
MSRRRSFVPTPRPDGQVVEWDFDAFQCLLTADLSDDLAGLICHGVHWNMTLQFVNECSPALANVRRVGAMNAMHQFSHSRGTNGDLKFAKGLIYVLKKLLDS